MKGLCFAIIPIWLLLAFELPKGWFKAGSTPLNYAMEIDYKEVHEGRKAATFRSLDKNIQGYGLMMQQISAEHYRGQRLRLKGWLKSANVSRRAGLWLQTNLVGTIMPGVLDNMQDRPIKGDTEWAQHEIVLDIPTMATVITFGISLQGDGQVWVDNMVLEVVGKDVPVTKPLNKNIYMFDTIPRNLNFEQ
jgi:hypothetical protein